MNNQLFKAFISGSSFPAILSFYIGFKSLEKSYKNINLSEQYILYTLIAPIYFGFNSVYAVILSNILNTNFRYGFLIISLISPSLLTKINNVYIFNNLKFGKKYLYIYNFVNYNMIIANIYSLLS